MWSDHEIGRIFENLSKLVVDMILDCCYCPDSDLIDGIMEFERLDVEETFSFEKTRVFLDLRRSFHLLCSSILKHLSPHLGKSLASVFLELSEGISDIVFELTYELLCGVSKWIDVSHLRENIDFNVLFRRWMDSCSLRFFFTIIFVVLDRFHELERFSDGH